MRRGFPLVVVAALLVLVSGAPADPPDTSDSAPWHVSGITKADRARVDAPAADPGTGTPKYLHLRLDFNPATGDRRMHKFRVVDQRGRTVGELYGHHEDRGILVFENEQNWTSLKGLYLDGLGHREPLFTVEPVAPKVVHTDPVRPVAPVVGPPPTVHVPRDAPPTIYVPPVQVDVPRTTVVPRTTTQVIEAPAATRIIRSPTHVLRVPDPVRVITDRTRVITPHRTRVVHEGTPVVHEGVTHVVGVGDGVGGGVAVGDGVGVGGGVAIGNGVGGGVAIGDGVGGGGGVGVGGGAGAGAGAAAGPDQLAGAGLGPWDMDPLGQAVARTLQGLGTATSIGTGGAAGVGVGSGAGSGAGTGMGAGAGPGVGAGTGAGPGGPGTGPGALPGMGAGTGPGAGQGALPGMGPAPGTGPGQGPGAGPGAGQGAGPGQGPGTGLGEGQGMGPGQGQGMGPGQGEGVGPGQGQGMGPGQGPGMGPGEGPGMGLGEGCDTCPAEGLGTGPGEGPGPYEGEGPGPEEGPAPTEGEGRGPAEPDGPRETGPRENMGPMENQGPLPGMGPGPGGPGGAAGGAGGPGTPTIGPNFVNMAPQFRPRFHNLAPHLYDAPEIVGPDIYYYAPEIPYYNPELPVFRPGYPGYGRGYGYGGGGGYGYGGGGGGDYPERKMIPLPPLGEVVAEPQFVLYISCGDESGPGQIFQVTESGGVLGMVNLPFAATGLALHRQHGLIAAIPRDGGKLMRIDDTGKVSTIMENDETVVHPIDVALAADSDTVVVADNIGDCLAALTTAGSKPKIYHRFEGQKWDQQKMSVAVTTDKHVIFGSDGEDGIYRFAGDDFTASRGPLLPGKGGVAADTSSLKWAATQGRDQILVFEGEELMNEFELPANMSFHRHGLLSFGLTGAVVAAARQSDEVDGDPWLIQYETEENENKPEIRNLFKWNRAPMLDFVVGPRMYWERHDPKPYKSIY